MAAPKILTCTCCGAEITAPQFFNGKPYGWTCIKKVNPAAKQVKVVYVTVEVSGVFAYSTNANITADVLTTGTFGYSPMLVIKHNGKKAYINCSGATVAFVQDGTMFVEERAYKAAIAKL